MPKINFNVAVIDKEGKPQMRGKVDRDKIRREPNGRMVAEPITDADGYIVMEPVPLREVLGSIVDNIYNGDESMTAEDRKARGKLARKVSDSSNGSNKNYTAEEITILTDCMIKGQLAPSIVSQVDDIINGVPSAVDESAQAA